MIHLNELSKSYGNHKVLQNISISFERGKVYGIVGENGAGKTTLFKCIAGLETHEGLIDTDVPKLKDVLGLLPTEPYFFPKITGREYLQLLCHARAVKENDVEKKNIFDLPLDQYASQYSTGMKKKLALLGVLLQKNEILILDEPYNGVDIQSNLIITEIIHKLKALNKTVLISSHIFSSLKDTCDEIHVLKSGSFTPKVLREDFDRLENDMKSISIGNKIDRLQLG